MDKNTAGYSVLSILIRAYLKFFARSDPAISRTKKNNKLIKLTFSQQMHNLKPKFLFIKKLSTKNLKL
jgi:hypothetical protein